ncbi:hypothetical protein [Acetivibrio cellulolyticus]|uniref:hypothetical protein n=1 Tax=Acetivibrio cellulolyticus TaxID=35830 RepID=UPI0001E2F11A|nr:hypothetical protein [Acetivibrio cellulolyticus]
MPNYLNKNAMMPKMNPYMSPCQHCGAEAASQFTQALPSTQMPTGIPTGPMYSSPMPVQQTTPMPVSPVPVGGTGGAPETVQNIQYTQGYLKTQIGRHVKIEFLIGTNMLQDREGTLLEVGTSYVIIRETETDDLLLCDMYSIKFVRFYY